jgi:peptidoglycan/xylan/chitin deacetylase (PgdA/CDA1 family)
MSTRVGVAVALGAAALHTAPALTAIAPLRRRLWPGLSGLRAATAALTFDDGPDPRSTPAFLDALAALHVTATFFVLGEMAAHAPDLLLRLPPTRVYDELARTVELLEQVLGERPRWFRPPYGVLSAGSCLATARLGLRPLLWSAWGRDWEARATPDSVLSHLRRGGLRPGATLLLHDSDCTSAPGAWRSALAALPAIVQECRTAGASLVSMSEHMR